MRNYRFEQARTQTIDAIDLVRAAFGDDEATRCSDAEFLSADRTAALGVSGLPFEAPICEHLLADPVVSAYLDGFAGSQLLVISENKVSHVSERGASDVPASVTDAILVIADRVIASPGSLNENGELVLDLKNYPVGPHYPVNLLLGNRMGYPYPLVTTPKSALDGLGRGSFRGTGGKQVLQSRYVLALEENGEPANRQFYLVENGRQIFYSAAINENVKSATCVHSQSRTTITYETEDGLTIRRTIFILPQEDGMPNAVEAQRVEVTNHTDHTRDLQIVMTGMFGITEANTMASDIVYANVVIESEMLYQGDEPVAMTVHHKPKDCQGEKRFATLLCEGGSFDSFAVSYPDFIGDGTLQHPELVSHLPNRFGRKMTPFFAMGRSFSVDSGATETLDEFVGMVEGDGDVADSFDAAIHKLVERYADPAELTATYQTVVDFWNKYPSYLQVDLGDERLDAYVGHNLPFQVLYQTYVSRAFAWTQKSYREIGFREIQDIYASMYYLNAMGEGDLIKELLSNWIRSVWRMGYAYHDFTFTGKEPGDCSDDQLWLVQAVYRYVKLTGDLGFLSERYPVAGTDGEKRTLWETLVAIITYSGKISVGRHGLPLLDKADWNDALRIDPIVMKGPEKEERYQKQLSATGTPYGTPLENDLTESVMNACLLKIAADEMVEMAAESGREVDGALAGRISARIYDSMQANAWKGDFFARCLINDDRPYRYLGAGFIGTPQMDFFPGSKLVRTGDQYTVDVMGYTVKLTAEQNAKLAANGVESRTITLGIRPVHLILDDPNGITATIDVSELMGSERHLHMTANGTDVVAVVQTANLDPNAYPRKSQVKFGIDGRLAHLFDPETEKNLI